MIKAAVLAEPNKIEIRNFPRPNTDNGILLKIESVGVCGTDVHIFNGRVPGLPYPIIQGHEICGTIEEISDESNVISNSPLGIGDRVILVPGTSCKKCHYCKFFPHMENYCQHRSIYGVTMCCSNPPHLFGGFAEYLYVLPNFWVYKLPKKISTDVGVLVETFAVAMRAVERGFYPTSPFSAGLGIACNVVIQGAGPVGLLAALSAKIAGGNVIILDKIDFRLKMAKKIGINNTLNIKNLTKEKRIKTVKEMTRGLGTDIVVECTGELEAVEEGIPMLRKGGRYIELGHFADVGEVRLKPFLICRNDLEIIGSVIAPPQQFQKVLDIMEKYDLNLEQMITHRFKLGDTEKAIKNVEERNGVKTIIKPF